jgi:hypothetical protein
MSRQSPAASAAEALPSCLKSLNAAVRERLLLECTDRREQVSPVPPPMPSKVKKWIDARHSAQPMPPEVKAWVGAQPVPPALSPELEAWNATRQAARRMVSQLEAAGHAVPEQVHAMLREAPDQYAMLLRNRPPQERERFRDAIKGQLDQRDAAIDSYARQLRQQVAAAGGTPRRRRPSARLKIVRRTVYLDGEIVPLDMAEAKTDDALAFLRALCKEPGNWISTTKIGKDTHREGVRFDKVFAKLPQAIKSLIDSKPGAGYCLRLA